MKPRHVFFEFPIGEDAHNDLAIVPVSSPNFRDKISACPRPFPPVFPPMPLRPTRAGACFEILGQTASQAQEAEVNSSAPEYYFAPCDPIPRGRVWESK